jgi:hypothetical protein
MPSANATTATPVSPGFLASVRRPNRISWRIDICPLPGTIEALLLTYETIAQLVPAGPYAPLLLVETLA